MLSMYDLFLFCLLRACLHKVSDNPIGNTFGFKPFPRPPEHTFIVVVKGGLRNLMASLDISDPQCIIVKVGGRGIKEWYPKKVSGREDF